MGKVHLVHHGRTGCALRALQQPGRCVDGRRVARQGRAASPSKPNAGGAPVISPASGPVAGVGSRKGRVSPSKKVVSKTLTSPILTVMFHGPLICGSNKQCTQRFSFY